MAFINRRPKRRKIYSGIICLKKIKCFLYFMIKKCLIFENFRELLSRIKRKGKFAIPSPSDLNIKKDEGEKNSQLTPIEGKFKREQNTMQVQVFFKLEFFASKK